MHERNHFDNDSFEENNIRHPRLEDIPALLHLETECWPELLRASPETILHRIEHFPAGHLVYELNSRLGRHLFSENPKYRTVDDDKFQECFFTPYSERPHHAASRLKRASWN